MSRNKQYYLLETLILTIITSLFCFKFHIAYNEMDIIAYTKNTFRFMSEWNISTPLPSNFLFNWILGYLLNNQETLIIIFIGRIISYIFISYSYIKLSRTLNINSYLSTLSYVIFLYYFENGIGDAGEWMVGGLESKVIAYALTILSLSYFLREKYKTGTFLAGIAVSTHLLVGGYNILCLCPVLVLIAIRNVLHFKTILQCILLFLITGAIGILSILNIILSNTPKNIQEEGWGIYVNTRVPHHLIPNFETNTWIILIILTLVNLLHLKNKSIAKKYLATYSLSTIFILSIGLLIYYTSETHYLRIYFFRFSDSMLPLITILLLASLNISSRIRIIIFTLTTLFILPNILKEKEIKRFILRKSYNLESIYKKTDPDIIMTKWIMNNTSDYDIFIVPPEKLYFCMNTEREVFITWWMLPNQKEYKTTRLLPNEMIEWYNRLKLLNQNMNFSTLKEVKKNYSKLDTQSILNIQSTYKSVKYILTTTSKKLDFPIVKKTEKQILYQITTTH